MRITCPSCKAQYEIDDVLLPEDGREVQCSACGTVWFQDHPAAVTRHKPEPVPVAPQPPAKQEPIAEPEPEAPTPEPSERPQSAVPGDASAQGAAPKSQLAPKPVDEKVLDILREEAAFEAEQRARDVGGLETQPDLGLAGPAPWPSTASDDSRTDATQTTRTPEAKAQPFPDIEDISASLEPIKGGRGRGGGKSEAVAVPLTSAERNSSFIRGLTLPLAVAVILVALYLVAPIIGGAVPALAPVTDGFVGAVDGLRSAIAGLLGR